MVWFGPVRRAKKRRNGNGSCVCDVFFLFSFFSPPHSPVYACDGKEGREGGVRGSLQVTVLLGCRMGRMGSPCKREGRLEKFEPDILLGVWVNLVQSASAGIIRYCALPTGLRQRKLVGLKLYGTATWLWC